MVTEGLDRLMSGLKIAPDEVHDACRDRRQAENVKANLFHLQCALSNGKILAAYWYNEQSHFRESSLDQQVTFG
jgi:hypothetical protein